MDSFTIKIKLAELFDAFSLALDLAEERQLGHARRTASIALLIAMHYGVKGYELNNIYYTAMLHDIGLSQSEDNEVFEIDTPQAIRDHAVYGSKLVAQIPYMENISPFIKYHHERWDGKGQPEGLKGRLIPLVSRIVHLADSIESHIQVKSSDKYALQNFLVFETGKQFDPNLAKIAYEIVNYDEFYETISHPLALLEDLRPQDQIEVNNLGLLTIGHGLADVIDSKSKYTANHSREVAEFSAALAKHFGYKGESLHKLEVAALLHDIGKLGIPTDILHKPGALTEQEYQMITYHPCYSELILNQVKGFQEIASWASSHHEKLDGSGYHKNLQGEQIPLESRIIAVADVFQAIISDRPYRAALPYDQVMDIMMDMAERGHLDYELFSEFMSIAPAFELHTNKGIL